MRFDLDHPTLRLGLVEAEGVSCQPSARELLFALSTAEAAVRSEPTRFPEAVRSAIRDVLRKGGYKPTGRGKPASEFLLGAALAEGLPRINNLVDINNLVSLEHAHPISIFDADRLGPERSVRFGRAGESYVFNAAGQSMDIAGLPVICRGLEREAVGNAVKDSMTCKVQPGTTRVAAVVYGSRELPPEQLEVVLSRLAELLRTYAGAAAVEAQLLP